MWDIIYDGIIAFLASVGLVSIFWLVADAVFRRKEKKEKEKDYGRALHGGRHRRNHHLSK